MDKSSSAKTLGVAVGCCLDEGLSAKLSLAGGRDLKELVDLHLQSDTLATKGIHVIGEFLKPIIPFLKLP
ncbi:hypothetical protein Tco_0821858 [Tanacetum coccineum]|uniref:Uncharacterized protein n=1 Tax=Tanacetum coccineum TaxID=301880 RepID=A0ABQ5AHV1_9ASTR